MQWTAAHIAEYWTINDQCLAAIPNVLPVTEHKCLEMYILFSGYM